MERRDIRAGFKLDDSIIDTLPRMRLSPGTYNGTKIMLGPTILFDRKSATHAAVSRFGSRSKFAVLLRRYSTRLPSSGTLRHAAITMVPWFNTRLQKVDSGFFCDGCPLSPRQFTVTSFDDHLKTFGNIKYGKHTLRGSEDYWGVVRKRRYKIRWFVIT